MVLSRIAALREAPAALPEAGEGDVTLTAGMTRSTTLRRALTGQCPGARMGCGWPRHTGGMSEGVHEVLLEKQRDIRARMDDLTAAPDSTGGISFGKRVGDGTSLAVERITQVAAHEQLLLQAEEVERALAKLDEGTYGECDVCGAVIPEGRLEIHPWAVLCVPCANGG